VGLVEVSSPLPTCLGTLVRVSLGLVIAVLFGASLCRAQGTYTAKSCNYSDVNAVINGPTHTVVNGDTINIPSGTCTWTSILTAPSNVGFTLIGSGTPSSGPSTTGASTSCTATEIIDNAGSATSMMSLFPAFGNSLMRVSCMDIEPESTSTQLISPIGMNGTCAAGGCPNIRIDNITFGLNTQWNEANNSSGSGTMTRDYNVFGVLDHNTAPSGNDAELFNNQMTAYLGVGANGDNSWAQPDSFGTANNLFAENNSWNTLHLSLNDCETGFIGGCRVVDRFNTLVQSNPSAFGIFENHGNDTSGRGRSGREAEVYSNTITCQSNCAAVDGGIRGGTGLFWGNHANLTPGQGASTWLGISLYRAVYNNNPWATCGGSGPYDQNDGTVYFSGTVTAASNSQNWGGGSGNLTMTDTSKTWSANQLNPTGDPYSVYDVTKGWWGEIASNTSNTITVIITISEQANYGFTVGDSYQILRSSVCVDQPGRGAGIYLSSTAPAPVGNPSQVLDPIYQWNDSYSCGANVNSPLGSTFSRKIIANRDYYPQASGVQTSPSSPFNGTSGTGWGTLSNRPTTCTPQVGYWATDQGDWNQSASGGQGELFVCTATNTWTMHYEPYTYPHPLIAGGSTSGNLPQPPTNLSATVN
jgi:hypothetical protein